NLVPGGGGWNNRARKAFRTGHNIRPAIIPLQSIGAGVKNQPARRRATIAAGTRLRRRLSKIFQRLKTESGLGSVLPSPKGTQDLSQSMNTQSPRIQRCCRLHHAMQLFGQTSSNSISAARPPRTCPHSSRSPHNKYTTENTPT